MKKVLILVALLSLTVVAASGSGDRKFRASLEGGNEVPPVQTDTSGKFRIEFEDDYSEATFRLDLDDAVRVTQAHLHCGERGENGPVVAFLFGFHDAGWDVDGTFLKEVTLTDANIINTETDCGSTLEELAHAIREGKVYVNVHSVAVPSGVVRGQVH